MPGVRVVEEPDIDLWFQADQCIDPESAREALERHGGFFGLGQFMDPAPWELLGGYGAKPRSHETGKGRRRPAGAPYDPATSIDQPEYEEVGPEEELRRVPGPSPELLERLHLDPNLPAHLQGAPDQVLEDVAHKILFLSVNSKTGFSFNVRIAGYHGILGERWWVEQEKGSVDRAIIEEARRMHPAIPGTCAPTEWCYAHCYAKTGHYLTWDEEHWYDLSRQQARYLQNLIVTEMLETAPQSEVDQAADSFYEAVLHEYNTNPGVFEDAPLNIRWNGGGDFNLGAARIVTALNARHPDLIVWGFSRKPTTADQLKPHPSLRMNFSLDPTTPPYGRSGFKLDDLVKAACKLRSNMVYATDIVQDPRVEELRPAIHQLCGGMTGIATVFGYHCGSKHTEIADRQECSATNPRVYGWCQKCRWCAMSHEERLAEDVTTPNQAFFLHGGTPDLEEIDADNVKLAKAGHPLIVPMTEDEVWGV